jgi:hypothetical protein
VQGVSGSGSSPGDNWYWAAVAASMVMLYAELQYLGRFCRALDQREETQRQQAEAEAAEAAARLSQASQAPRASSAADGASPPADFSAAAPPAKKPERKKMRLTDILRLCKQDWRLFVQAGVGLTVAAAGESAIPFFTGKIIDSVTLDTDQAQFNKYMVYLLATGFVTGIFTAVRGSTFIVVGARFGIRMRKLLYASLLRQDIAFYDATKTGNITSRLSSDTDKVAGQVELNINVMARSMLQVTRIAGRRDGRALARRAGHRHVAPHCRR